MPEPISISAKDKRRLALARVFELIRSWPPPEQQSDAPEEVDRNTEESANETSNPNKTADTV